MTPGAEETSEGDVHGRLRAVMGSAEPLPWLSEGPRLRPLPWLGLALAFGLLLLLQTRIDLLWTQAPLWVPVLALGGLLLLRRVPHLVTALWSLGLLTYVWSLAPGNTLLASVWGLAYLALAAAGRFRWVLLAVVGYVVLNNLDSALALNFFGQQRYFSGSVHYLLGAKALVAFAPALAGFVTIRRLWLAVPLWALATVSAYGALMSGSRGVYVPLVVIALAALARLARSPEGRRRALVGVAAMAIAIVAVDALLPPHPIAEALGMKASLHAQETSLAAQGGFSQRIRFWEQGLAMAAAHPFGVGLGGFRSTIHAFERFPMVWSSSPHDVFVETAATLGWPGLAILVVLLAAAFWRAWTSERWPWALALLGIWFTLAVDITADYPSVMTIAFAVVGACMGPWEPPSTSEQRRWLGRGGAGTRSLAAFVALAGIALSAWWFVPCSRTDCALTRWRGVEFRVVAALPKVPAAQRGAFFSRLERLYPVSLWVLQLEERYATSPLARLALARRIALRYPLESWRNYLAWANLSLAAGDLSQAKEAARRGLAVFGPDATRYPGWRSDPAAFRAWLARAHQILAEAP